MFRFKSYPLFYSLIAALALAAVVSSWFIYERSQAAQKSTKAFVKKNSELSALLSSVPAPSEPNKLAVKDDLAHSEAALAEMREELKGHGASAEALMKARAAYVRASTLNPGDNPSALLEVKVPLERTDLFFNLASFVEKMRKLTQAANIKIKADERFGFTTYANEGPARDLIPIVYRQRQVAEYLIEALIEAKPTELVALQRENPLPASTTDAVAKPVVSTSRSGAVVTNTDLFEIDPRITARVSGFVAASAFRLTFIGETGALRNLLNKLATFELPLVVRGVEVDPIVKPASADKMAQANTLNSIFGTAPATTAETVKPKALVEKVLSKFTVTVELIDLVDSTPTEASPTH